LPIALILPLSKSNVPPSIVSPLTVCTIPFTSAIGFSCFAPGSSGPAKQGREKATNATPTTYFMVISNPLLTLVLCTLRSPTPTAARAHRHGGNTRWFAAIGPHPQCRPRPPCALPRRNPECGGRERLASSAARRAIACHLRDRSTCAHR